MRKLILWLLGVIYVIGVNGQSDLDDFSYRIYYQTTSTDTAVFDSLFNRICELTLPDSIGMAVIHVKVGTTEGSGDVVQHGFVFDQTNVLPQGLSYRRQGLTVKLGLLQTYHADLYFYEVWLEDANGLLSEKRLYR